MAAGDTTPSDLAPVGITADGASVRVSDMRVLRDVFYLTTVLGGRVGDAIVIRWADGSLLEIRPDGERFALRAWPVGTALGGDGSLPRDLPAEVPHDLPHELPRVPPSHCGTAPKPS